jgi:hypothetical protein
VCFVFFGDNIYIVCLVCESGVTNVALWSWKPGMRKVTTTDIRSPPYIPGDVISHIYQRERHTMMVSGYG